jgi:hypothetical protein
MLAERVCNTGRSGQVLRRPHGLRLSPSPRQTADREAYPKQPMPLSESSAFAWQLLPLRLPAVRGSRRVQKGSGSSGSPGVSRHQPRAGRRQGLRRNSPLRLGSRPTWRHARQVRIRSRPARSSAPSVGWHQSAVSAPPAPDRRGGFRPLKRSSSLKPIAPHLHF